MAKNLFSGLVKYVGNDYSKYTSAKAEGKLIFAEITEGENAGKYIYANGVEYKVSASIDIDELIQRIENVSSYVIDLSTFVRETVDVSVADLSTRMSVVETSVGAAIEDISFGTEEANSSVNIKINSKTISGTGETDFVSLKGDDYVKVGSSENKKITLTTTIGDIATATEDASGLATAHDVSVFVHNAISGIEGALVYRGTVASESDLNTVAATASKGDVYVASTSFTGSTYNADEGDMFIWNGTTWNHVERNLDQAVQATNASAFTDGNLIIGKGNHLVESTNVALTDVQTAIANANSAVQDVSAQGAGFVNAAVTTDGSTKIVNVSVNTHDVSTAAANANGLATALGVKEYVDSKSSDVKVQYSLNSSTSNYVKTSSEVDSTGRVISSSVGVVVITLADASNGSTGLADAKNVYDELTAVEEVMAAANAAMATTIGLNTSYGVEWSQESGIPANSTFKEAIEGAYGEAHKSGVVSIGGANGVISIDATGDANHNVVFTMDSSTLRGNVDLSGINSSISALNSSVSVLNSSVSALNTSVNDHETRITTLEGASHVTSVTGESKTLTNANTNYVNVSASTNSETGAVTINSSVDVATKTWNASITPATASGLATDAYVKNYVAEVLLWDVIE